MVDRLDPRQRRVIGIQPVNFVVEVNVVPARMGEGFALELLQDIGQQLLDCRAAQQSRQGKHAVTLERVPTSMNQRLSGIVVEAM